MGLRPSAVLMCGEDLCLQSPQCRSIQCTDAVVTTRRLESGFPQSHDEGFQLVVGWVGVVERCEGLSILLDNPLGPRSSPMQLERSLPTQFS